MTVATARAAGRSGDVLIFVHGVGSTAAIWDAQMARFAERYRCFAIELRGNGVPKPEAPPETITRQGFVEDVLGIADAAGAARFHFIGCSLGGVVGFELWRSAAARLASMTFVGSFAAYPDAGAYVAAILAAVDSAGTMERFARERAAKLGMPAGRRTDESIAQMACKSPDSYRAATRATWTADYRTLLPSIAAPALVLCGEHDVVAPVHLSQEIAAGIPEARLTVLPGAGHVANADAPDAFNDVLEGFLANRPAS